MATTVGSHSVSAFATPVNGGPLDANIVRGNDNTIRTAYVSHDADTGIHVQSSTLATRPAAGTAGRKWITEDSGVYTLWFDDGTNWHPVSSENVALTVLAKTALTKGDVVKVTGWNNGQDLPEVEKVASASDVAFAIMSADATINTMGYATNTGIVQDLNTNAFNAGDILYPNTSGGFTATKPTSGSYQVAAYVLRKGTTNGVVFVEFSGPRIVEASANTASTIVLRDASGNFSAGTITAGALTASGAVSAGSVTSTGLVTFASLKGTGATTVTDILNDGTMATASATTLATSSSIKTYVDAKVATVDTLAEVLANGNTTGSTDIVVSAGQKIRTPAVAAQDGTAAITIANSTGALTFNTALADSNLATIATAGKVSNSATTATALNTASAIVARDASGNFSAGTITATLNGAAPAGSLSGSTLASGVTASSLTSVGTLSSLTVSGDLTVDTSTLKVDSANNRVGFGTASPSYRADISNGGGSAAALRVLGNDQSNVRFRIENSGSGGRAFELTGGLTGANNSDFTLYDATAAATRLTVDASGNLAVDTNTLYVDAANNRVGIGTASPGETLDVKGTGNFNAVGGTYLGFQHNATQVGYVGTANAIITGGATTNFGLYAQSAMVFSSGGATERMRLDASGMLGLGVTPSAWNTGFPTLQLGTYGAFVTGRNATNQLFTGVNAYFDGTNWKYANTAVASRYYQSIGAHIWDTAASGTAGNTISWTQAMTLDASGNLAVSANGSAAALLTAANRGNITANGTDASILTLGVGGASKAWFFATSTAAYLSTVNNPLIFETNSAERARITSGGNVLVGKSADDTTTAGVQITSGGIVNSAGTTDFFNAYSTSAAAYRFYVTNGGTIFATSTTISAISDARLKENIRDLDVGLDAILALKPRKYDWKEGKGQDKKDVRGFIAQEFEEVFPDLIDEWKDTAPEGEEPYRSVRQDLIPVLVKAIQELDAKNKALEARLEALEA